MSDGVKDAAQALPEEAFDGLMLWLKRGTVYSILLLGVVVFGCNAGVEDDAYLYYNGGRHA